MVFGRREFLAGLGGAAVWPVAARGQTGVPVIGFLGSGVPQAYEAGVAAVRQGLGEIGFVEGRNVAFDFRWAHDRIERLPTLATELVERRVAVILAFGAAASLPAKTATTTIPVVFTVGGDPVQLGLVASVSRPGGNVTGVSVDSLEVIPKKMEFLREIVPNASVIAMLTNPNDPNSEADISNFQKNARAVGQKVIILIAGTEAEIDRAWSKLMEERVGALMVQTDAILTNLRDQLITHAARHAIPAIYSQRELVAAGGLMSYGSNLFQVRRQAGLYAGHILKGDKPADLPVMFPTRFELVLNLKTARALGIDIPLKLHAFADEVIE
jgi:ABC-type uncharacterized transport system substrate-binding protein